MVYTADITIKSRDWSSTLYYDANRWYGSWTTVWTILDGLHNVGVNVAWLSLTAWWPSLNPSTPNPGTLFYEADAWTQPFIQHWNIATWHMERYIENDYSAMRWPCPEWFHIPSKSDFDTLGGIFATLASAFSFTVNLASVQNYLLMPDAWMLGFRDGRRSNYWIVQYRLCQSFDSSSDSYPATFMADSQNGVRRDTMDWYPWSSGKPIRPLKDVPVEPDSSWTCIVGISGGRGIFHNATLWLISYSSDWANRYTMADKNLWATVVYNTWDTLSEANCGKFYQWWNNYWFSFTGPSTTTTTPVDASTYWPWNYYSGSTFILPGSTYSYKRDTSWNQNLRWWVTWVIHREWRRLL